MISTITQIPQRESYTKYMFGNTHLENIFGVFDAVQNMLLAVTQSSF